MGIIIYILGIVFTYLVAVFLMTRYGKKGLQRCSVLLYTGCCTVAGYCGCRNNSFAVRIDSEVCNTPTFTT